MGDDVIILVVSLIIIVIIIIAIIVIIVDMVIVMMGCVEKNMRICAFAVVNALLVCEYDRLRHLNDFRAALLT